MIRPAMTARRPRGSRRPQLRVTAEEFESLVAKAVDSLPEEFAALLENVAVTVEEEPSDEDLESVGMEPEEGDELFGLYLGVPLTERDSFYGALPDRIAVYRGPILRACATRREAIAEIRETVLHELGHFFGMEEEDMPY
jgi:predicted Zn-dependent protease with MMP-like domain